MEYKYNILLYFIKTPFLHFVASISHKCLLAMFETIEIDAYF